MSNVNPPAKATRREWIGLAIIALPCMVYAMDLTVLNLALPAISAELGPSASQLLWIVDVYGFLVAGFLITMGTLGDRIGRRRLLLIGAAAFAAASVIAAFSRSAEMLIAMRALLGVAGATLAPSTMSLIRNMFHDEHERQFAIGVWIAAFSVGGAIGPLVGGLLLQWWWWGAAFLAAVPVMVLLLLLGPKLLPEYRDPDAGALDPLSMVQSLFSVLAVVYGLKRIAEYGTDARGIAVLLVGLALGVLFVRRQKHLAYPFLDVTLFRRPAFSAAIVAYALAGLSMMGVYIFMTQYLQLVLGLTPLQAGVATIPWSVCFTVGSLLAPRLARHWGARRVMVRGLLFAAVEHGHHQRRPLGKRDAQHTLLHRHELAVAAQNLRKGLKAVTRRSGFRAPQRLVLRRCSQALHRLAQHCVGGQPRELAGRAVDQRYRQRGFMHQPYCLKQRIQGRLPGGSAEGQHQAPTSVAPRPTAPSKMP